MLSSARAWGLGKELEEGGGNKDNGKKKRCECLYRCLSSGFSGGT